MWEEGGVLSPPSSKASWSPSKTPPFPSPSAASIPREETGCSTMLHCARTPHTPGAYRYWGASTSGRFGPHAPASGDLKYRLPHKSQRRYDPYPALLSLPPRVALGTGKGGLHTRASEFPERASRRSLSFSRPQYQGSPRRFFSNPFLYDQPS